MNTVYKDQQMNYEGKNYYKSISGIWLETNCKDSDSLTSGVGMKMSYNGRDNLNSDEKKIKNFAKKVAKTIKKPTSTIKIPFEKKIQYEVEKEIEVEEGWFIFKSTRTEKVTEQRTGTKVDYKNVSIDGWILKIYYTNVDTVIKNNCATKNNRYEKEIDKWIYALKRDGSLSIFRIGYNITFPDTNWEKLEVYQGLTEVPMTFESDGRKLGSAYLLDFKPIKWEVTSKREDIQALYYFKRNYPIGIGQCEAKGQSYLIQEAGTGIIEALKKLDNGRAKK